MCHFLSCFSLIQSNSNEKRLVFFANFVTLSKLDGFWKFKSLNRLKFNSKQGLFNHFFPFSVQFQLNFSFKALLKLEKRWSAIQEKLHILTLLWVLFQVNLVRVDRCRPLTPWAFCASLGQATTKGQFTYDYFLWTTVKLSLQEAKFMAFVK